MNTNPCLREDRREYLFTSESVSEGHPDKLADQISDHILDLFLEHDTEARVACETFITNDLVLIGGEFGTAVPGLFEALQVRMPERARAVIRDAGYDGTFPGIDPEHCKILLHLNRQSPDIHQGVDRQDGAIGAGDQGLMFGYACDETPELMPLPISLAHVLVKRQAELRQSGRIAWLRPDAKSQVTVRYRSERPVAVETVVVSTQHDSGIGIGTVREVVERDIVRAVIPDNLISDNFVVMINPTGRFVIGGPVGDCGLTGRKIIVDTYGGRCPHGGGAFSGKDPTKVDRTGAYAARYIAKNVVAAGLASRCTVQVAYAIGVAEPVSLMLDTHGTGRVADWVIEYAARKLFELSPFAIINDLELLRPLYRRTAVCGHFGRDPEIFPWERIDRVDRLRALCLEPDIERRTQHA